MVKVRLNKFLAEAGVASRRRSDDLIFNGEVSVNGQTASGPFVLVDTETDQVTCRGEKVESRAKVYFMIHKPLGVLCSSQKKFPNDKLVIDAFAHLPYRLFTVGRLDKETSGLLLVTNDGDFSNRIIHPSFGITKEYLVKVRQDVSAFQLKTFAAGGLIEDQFIRPIEVIKVRRGTLKVIVGEGKKHEVRLLTEMAGLTLLSLTRIRIGSLVLGGLAYGAYRELTGAEIASCFKKQTPLKKRVRS